MTSSVWPSGRKKGWSLGRNHGSGPSPNDSGGTTFHMNNDDPDMPVMEGNWEGGIAGIADINFCRSNRPKDATVILDGNSLQKGERGLVISLPVELTVRAAKVDPINRRDLNFSLLFWDALDLPRNNIIGLDGAEIEATLKSAGILRRSKVRFDGSWTAPECLIAAHAAVARALNEASPGRWAISRGDKAIAVPKNQQEEGGGLSVELRRIIPVPDGIAPLDDVLTFREKRRPESLALRERLDDVCKAIMNSLHPSFAKTSEFDALDRAVSDYLKVSKESGLKSIMSTLVGNIAVDKAIVAAGAIASGITLNMPLATAAGVVAGSMGVLSGASLKDFKRPNSPFEYIARYHDELHWGR